jgi:hypothetical protein
MVKNPLSELKRHNQAKVRMIHSPLSIFSAPNAHRVIVSSSEGDAETLCEVPLIFRHEDSLLARHQEAFLAAARRHAARAALLEKRTRISSAKLHYGIAGLLQAYAQPGEIERLPLVERPGPTGLSARRGVHPAMVAFAEGAAEEFFRIYHDPEITTVQSTHSGMENIFNAFRRANFHRIYIARLLEIDAILREGRASMLAESTLMRRYGPHDL